MFIPGPDKSEGSTRPQQVGEAYPETKEAVQLPSGGGEVEKILKKPPSLLGKLTFGFFDQRQKRNEITQKLIEIYRQRSAQFDAKLVEQTSSALSPHLQDLPLAALTTVESAIMTLHPAFLLGQSPRNLAHALQTATETVKNDPEGVKRTRFSQNFPKIQLLFSLTQSGPLCIVATEVYGQIAKGGTEFDENMARVETFVKQAEESSDFKEQVQKKTEDQRADLVKFSFTKAGNEFLMEALNSKDGAKIKKAVDDALEIQKNATMAATMQSAAKIMNRMTDEQQKQFMDGWIKTSAEMEPTAFDKFLKEFSEHLVKMDEVRAAEKGRAAELEREEKKSYEDLVSHYPEQMKHFEFLRDIPK